MLSDRLHFLKSMFYTSLNIWCLDGYVHSSTLALLISNIYNLATERKGNLIGFYQGQALLPLALGLSAVIPGGKVSDWPDCTCRTTREDWCNWSLCGRAGSAGQAAAAVARNGTAGCEGEVCSTRDSWACLGRGCLPLSWCAVGRGAGASRSHAWLVQEVVVVLRKTTASPAVFNWQLGKRLCYRSTILPLFCSLLRDFYG